MIKTHYKIRSKSTKLFNKGTTYNQWGFPGKVFTSLGNLNRFINRSLKDDYMRKTMSDWEVIEIEVYETIKNVKDVHSMLTPAQIISLISNTY